jgi:hypothetical protein
VSKHEELAVTHSGKDEGEDLSANDVQAIIEEWDAAMDRISDLVTRNDEIRAKLGIAAATIESAVHTLDPILYPLPKAVGR